MEVITLIDAVLFDLDGTLLPMDYEGFIQTYMGLLGGYMEEYGYEPRRLVQTVWEGTKAMAVNDGSKTNEEVFWDVFRKTFGPRADTDRELFEEFYAGAFGKTRTACGFDPASAELVRWLKDQGVRLVLATNPLFPRVATVQRIRWAGLDPQDFELVSTFEDFRHCKPNPDYYREVLERLGLDPAKCVMVGNDGVEDVAATQAGLEVFLLEGCLLHPEKAAASGCAMGDMEKLKGFLQEKLR